MNTRDVRMPWRRRIKRATRRLAKANTGTSIREHRRAIVAWSRAWNAWLLSYDGA